MADTKITALTALTAADPANDVIPIVDVSDTTMAASGTTKKISVNNILGASGTATLASATITGAATVGTTLGVTGQSTLTGNVGVGVAPSAGGSIYYKTLELGKAGCGLFAGTASLTGSELTYLSSNAVLTYSAGPLWSYGNNGSAAALAIEDGAFTFKQVGSGTAGNPITWTDSMTLNSAGNLAFPTGKGIDFSAVTGGTGTATANVLNDYEEGTFTPTVIGSTTAGVGVYSYQIGRYTKVGNLVSIQVYLEWTAHTGTGNMLFGNFPFSTSSETNVMSAAAFGYVHNISLTAGNILTGFSNPSATNIAALQTPTGGGSSGAVPIDIAGVVIFNLTYRA